jgi:hypothetical protein
MANTNLWQEWMKTELGELIERLQPCLSLHGKEIWARVVNGAIHRRKQYQR